MSAEIESAQARTQKLEGLGTRRKRVEDARFTQGKGNYIDDLKLPGMLFGDFVRSPYGHARVKSINKEAALELPGVKAVLTADDLKPLKLHWMPTLAGDVQAVLADEKVLFQGQEVAFVVAEDRYIAADAVDLVEVEYEELPALVDPTKSMAADAPVLRDDLKDKTSGAHGPRKHHNHVFTWEVGDAEGTARAVRDAAVVAKERIVYQRVHPCPLETCGCVASMDKVNGHLTMWGTFQAPHAVRTVASLISGIPEHKIRIISPDIGGGFGNKVGVYPGYICSIVASIVLGVPVKWVEDRMENLQATAFARDYHMTGEIAATREGRITGLRCHVLADHGAFDTCADPTKYPGRVLQHLHRLLRHPGRARDGRRRLHQQGAGRRRIPLLVPGDGGVLFHRADDRRPGAQARSRPGRNPPPQPNPQRAVSLPIGAQRGIRQRRLSDCA